MTTILFEPPLNVQTALRPAVSSDNTVRLTCRAKLSTALWETFQKRRASVEIWSNLPVENVNSGQWMPKAFEYPPPASIGTEAMSGSHGNKDVVELVAAFDIPATPHKQYSYTYRIKYASGEVQWLGSMNSNGTIAVKPVAYWTPNTETGSSVIGNLGGGGQWKGWSLGLGEFPTPITLPGNFRSSRTVYLVPEDTSKGLNHPPSILIHSVGDRIDVSGGIVYCDTPDKASAYAVTNYAQVLELLGNFGYTTIPSSRKDCLLVSSGMWDQSSSLQLCPIWVSHHGPSTVTLKPHHIRPLLPTWSNTCVISYPTIGHAILQQSDMEVTLTDPVHTVNLTCMTSLPQSSNQLVGISNPSKPHHLSPPLSPVSSVGYSTGSHPAHSGLHSDRPVFTVYKSSRILLSRKIIVPSLILRQIGRLLQVRFLAVFYRLVIYVLSLLTQIIGISFSVEWPSPSYSADQKVQLPDQKTLIQEYDAKQPNGTNGSSPAPEVLFDVISSDKSKDLTVLFDGEAADYAIFTLNGQPVDQSNIVQTWIRDNLHQFTLKAEEESSPVVLGISIGPGTPV